jgi:pyruvate kinase
MTHARAISRAARSLAEDLEVQALLGFTRTGRTAELLSQARPRVPILACTAQESVARRLALWWGVRPLLCSPSPNVDELIAHLERIVLEAGLVEPRAPVVVVGAMPFRSGVHANFLKLHQVRAD